MWTLDPTDINILTGGSNSSLTGSTIDPSYLVSQLNGTNITLNASNSITVSNVVDASGNASAGNLVFDAPTDYFYAPVTLKTGSTLSGNASTVNVDSDGLIQNAVDAAASGATVNLTLGLYNLSNEIIIDKNLTLNGNDSALRGQYSTRIMEIDGTGGGITVNLNYMALENGNGAGTHDSGSGGALLVYAQSGTAATVNINNCTFGDNLLSSGGYGGAIFNDGSHSGNASMNIMNSIIADNGLIGNGSGTVGGGGIVNYAYSSGQAIMTINNSTITSNQANSEGGAILNYGATGGNATMTITNSTITENASVTDAGGIDNWSGNLTIGNTILADNFLANNLVSGGIESDYFSQSNAVPTSNGYNLYGQNGNAGGFIPAAHDIELTNGICSALYCSNGMPISGGNGGLTATIALISGSPAIGTGGQAAEYATDQRGDFRPFTNQSIGAFEYNPVNPYVITSTADTGTPAIGTLRTAFDYANHFASNPTITFDATDFATAQTIAMDGNQFTIGTSLTLTGPTAGVILNAQGNSRVMEIDGTSLGDTVNLSNLTLENGLPPTSGNAAYYGAGLLVFSEGNRIATVNLSNSSLLNNSAPVGAAFGTIYNDAEQAGTTTLNITGSTISENSSANGTIVNDAFNGGNATLTINDSTIANNTVFNGAGGAILNNYYNGGSANLTITNSTITGNSATIAGGVFNAGGTLTIGNSILAGNTSSGAESDLIDNGTFITIGYNLYGQNNNDGGFTPTTTDIKLAHGICTALNCGSGTTPALGSNGGLTQTIALASGSPAIGTGDPAQLVHTDQRGVVRSGSVDMGASQYAIAANTTNNSTIPSSVEQETGSQTVNPLFHFGYLLANPSITIPPLPLTIDATLAADLGLNPNDPNAWYDGVTAQ